MNSARLEEFRTMLLALRSDLESLEASSTEAARPVELDQASVGRLSRMDAIQMQQMAREADRRRRSQLTRIAGALQRIESGDYGFCIDCGEEIDERRLCVDPTTLRCTGCAQAATGATFPHRSG